uniref:Uncharacterized protein n=1 Tax=Bursaphelenchus xylophilus TaxID=6326 RepID=A0A1I7RJ04_BURXY
MQPMSNYVSLGVYKPSDRFTVTPRRAYRQKGGYATTNRLENLLTPNSSSTISGSILSSRAPSTITLNQSSNQSSVPSGPVSPAPTRQNEGQRQPHYDFNQHYPSEDNLAKHRFSDVGQPKLRTGGGRSSFAQVEEPEVRFRERVRSEQPVLACELRREESLPSSGLIDFDREFQRVFKEFQSLHGGFGKAESGRTSLFN